MICLIALSALIKQEFLGNCPKYSSLKGGGEPEKPAETEFINTDHRFVVQTEVAK